MALTQEQRDLLRLAGRSPEIDGMIRASPALWPLLARFEMPETLLERFPAADGNGGHVRLTDEGKTLLEWL